MIVENLVLINPVDFIAVNGSKILLAKRSKPGWNAQNTWCFPGGAVENNENFEVAVYREIQEELGCEIKWMKYFKSYIMEIQNVLARSVYFYGELSGEIALKKDELSEYRWLDVNDTRLFHLDYAFNQKQVLTDFINFWKNNKFCETP